MTFNDFINSFQNGIDLILNNLGSFFSNLTSNYFVMVLLGLTLFVSFFFFFYDSLFDFIHSYINRHFSTDNDMYDNFDKFQKMKMKWYDNNMDYLYKLKYVNFVVAQNVKSMYKKEKSERDIEELADNPDTNERIVYPHELAHVRELFKDSEKFKNRTKKDYDGMSYEELHQLNLDLKNEINSDIDRIEKEYSYLKK